MPAKKIRDDKAIPLAFIRKMAMEKRAKEPKVSPQVGEAGELQGGK